MKELEYVVNEDGTFSVETIGTQGTECVNSIKKVLQAVNGTVVDEKKKREYFDKSPKATITGGAN